MQEYRSKSAQIKTNANTIEPDYTSLSILVFIKGSIIFSKFHKIHIYLLVETLKLERVYKKMDIYTFLVYIKIYLKKIYNIFLFNMLTAMNTEGPQFTARRGSRFFLS